MNRSACALVFEFCHGNVQNPSSILTYMLRSINSESQIVISYTFNEFICVNIPFDRTAGSFLFHTHTQTNAQAEWVFSVFGEISLAVQIRIRSLSATKSPSLSLSPAHAVPRWCRYERGEHMTWLCQYQPHVCCFQSVQPKVYLCCSSALCYVEQ